MHNNPAPIPSRRPRLGKTAAGLLGIAALIASAGLLRPMPWLQTRMSSRPNRCSAYGKFSRSGEPDAGSGGARCWPQIVERQTEIAGRMAPDGV